MFGEKLRELREANGLAQRQVAAALDVDTAYISKLERNEKPASRSYITKLARLLNHPESELLTLWLADKLYKLVKDETLALPAIDVARKAVADRTLPNQPNGR